MYRAYQSITPITNRYLKKIWDDRYYDEHREKVRTARTMLDTNKPITYKLIPIKLKALQLQEERNTTTECDDKDLLLKMAYIIKHGGKVDSHKYDYIKKSSNEGKRLRELTRVANENMAILNRILKRETNYSNARLKRDHQMNQQYMMNVSRYQHRWKPEQDQYKNYAKQQTAANQRIRRKIGLKYEEYACKKDDPTSLNNE